MSRFPFLPVLLLVAPFVLGAGAPAEDLSVDPRAFAWYAHGAAEAGRTAATENLRAYLRDTSSADGRPVYLARLVAIDALVRLRAALPGEELRDLLHGGPSDAAAVLAVRHATLEAARTGFDAMDEEPTGIANEDWIAVGNRLLRDGAPGLAVRVLARLRFELRIHLDDRPGPVAYRPPRGSIPGDAIFPVPEGFPPIPVYHLESTPGSGSELLIDGRRPVHVRRYVCRERFGAGDVVGEPHRDDVRVEWLADLLGVEPEGTELELYPCRSLGFPSEEVLLERIAVARAEVAAAFDRVADRCRSAGLLTAAEREWVRPRIEVVIVDRRSRKDRAVPGLPAVWDLPPPPPIPALPPDPPVERPAGPRTR